MQLDKPVYKPGDMLRFRVVVVDVDTRPVTNIKTVQVKLTDKDENSIMEWPFGRLYNGVFEASFQLASSPVLGNWTLTVTAGSSVRYAYWRENVQFLNDVISITES